MRVSPFISGIATGAVAGAVVSMVAAGAMMNPSVRRSAQHAANKAEHAMHKAAMGVGHMIGCGGAAGEESALSPPPPLFPTGHGSKLLLTNARASPIMVTSSKGSRISSAVNIPSGFPVWRRTPARPVTRLLSKRFHAAKRLLKSLFYLRQDPPQIKTGRRRQTIPSPAASPLF